jgi:hypothetical protein
VGKDWWLKIDALRILNLIENGYKKRPVCKEDTLCKKCCKWLVYSILQANLPHQKGHSMLVTYVMINLSFKPGA